MIPGMMNGDHKKLATIIVGSDGKSKEADVESENLGLKTAAEELMAALKSENPSAVVEALKSFLELCEYEKESPSAAADPLTDE
jgi:hypothetical protein